MESWVPLFEIFLNSPTAETEASLWLKQSFNPSSSNPITTSSFLSLLTKPVDAVVGGDPSYSTTKRVMFIETLPDMVQARILSFLTVDRDRFCKGDLFGLARGILKEDGRVHFWVKRAARHLLDELSDTSYEWISGLGLESGEERMDEKFESLPIWLKDAASESQVYLHWLPVSAEELSTSELFGGFWSEKDSSTPVGEDGGDELKDVMEEMEIDHPIEAPLEEEIVDMAISLRARIMNFESRAKTVDLANEICKLCLTGRDAFAILNLIEPWKADDETASVLISDLSNRDGEKLAWPGQVLCAVILPKLLVLEEPASWVLVSATIDYCKIHQRAAEYALLYPLVMRCGGINTPICDLITRIIKECFHPAHVSAFCLKLLCGRDDQKKFVCLPCHQCLISVKLVWTEALFSLFHSILNLNVQITQDSADRLVLQIREMAQRFSNSLKFGNFLLCFITKCNLLLKPHKHLLAEAVEQTDTLITKSILSKLASL